MEDIREGDVGAILGWGFMPWSGGPFSWLDIIGAPFAVEVCDGLTSEYGERFTTPDLLRKLAKDGDSFYGKFGQTPKPQLSIISQAYPASLCRGMLVYLVFVPAVDSVVSTAAAHSKTNKNEGYQTQ